MRTSNKPKPDIAKIFAANAAIERAMQRGVREAILPHKRLGDTIFIGREGKVVEIPVDGIEVDE